MAKTNNLPVKNEILTRRQAAVQYLLRKRILWDNVEKLFHNQLNDYVSFKTNSEVFDPRLSTMLLERSYRVMSQLPTGKVKGISKNDHGAAVLMNLILDNYVVPNASSQFDFLTKMRMVDLYSGIYGNFFTLTDWNVGRNGYVGPDVWLLNIRDIFPQIGAVSLADSDYVIVRTWKPMSYFEGIKDQKGFKDVGKLLDKLKDTKGSKQNRDITALSKREFQQYPVKDVSDKGYFEVLTQFERDKWTDYCVDADMTFREIANPHENDELPIDCKYAIPLLDDFMGMGDIERGGSMQMAANANWNLYLDAVKMSIYPPVLINRDQVAVNSSIRYGAAEKWLLRTGQGPVQGAIGTVNLTPQGIQTFNNTYQATNAAMQNLFGTSDTTINQKADMTLGKTPQALEMQSQRENTRDNADRFYMEQYLESVMRKMVNLVSKKQSSAITLRMFEKDIQLLARDYPDIKDMYDEKTGKLTVNKKATGSILYDYEVESGSTYAVDQKTQQANLAQMLNLFIQGETPQGNFLVNQLKQDGYNFNFGELFKHLISNSGIQDWDDILQEQTDQEKNQVLTENNTNKFTQAIQAVQANLNAVPPTPQGQPPQGQPAQVPPQGQPAPQGQPPQMGPAQMGQVGNMP